MDQSLEIVITSSGPEYLTLSETWDWNKSLVVLPKTVNPLAVYEPGRKAPIAVIAPNTEVEFEMQTERPKWWQFWRRPHRYWQPTKIRDAS